MLIFLVIVAVLFGLVLYAIFALGLLGDGDSDGFSLSRPPRLRELSPGCLLSLIVAGSLWFVAWGIVLLLAIKLLRTPLSD